MHEPQVETVKFADFVYNSVQQCLELACEYTRSSHDMGCSFCSMRDDETYQLDAYRVHIEFDANSFLGLPDRTLQYNVFKFTPPGDGALTCPGPGRHARRPSSLRSSWYPSTVPNYYGRSGLFLSPMNNLIIYCLK